MIKLNDIKRHYIDDEHYRTKYKATCDACGVSRGYLSKQSAQKPLCRKCSKNSISKQTREKMKKAKLGKAPWNKGKTGISEETRTKMKQAKLGKTPWNKNSNIKVETRIKLSCINQNIDISEFDGFTTELSKRLRNKFSDMGLHTECFERYNFKCDCCGVYGVELHAHHLNSWKHFPEQRFDVTNLVSLCTICHKEFHSNKGNGKDKPNTKQQYIDFKDNRVISRKTVYVVAGAPGSGKSWVCCNFKNIYIPYDKISRKKAREIIWNHKSNVIVYDPMTNVSTFCSRNKNIFDIKLIIIQESEDVVRSRLLGRGGNFTHNVKRRIKRMKTLSKGAIFIGTSTEVLQYLKDELR